MKKLIHECVCKGTEFFNSTEHGIPLAVCLKCGVKHQFLAMDETDLENYYKGYHEKEYSHTLEHDCEVAKRRLELYKETEALSISNVDEYKILDIGCGNGAFVREALKQGFNIYGQEICKDSSQEPARTYEGELHSHNFPTDFFKTITMHDVIEHVLEPRKFLSEVFRMLEQRGTLVIDLPDFYSEDGVHHWKAIEHLWFFTKEQFFTLLEEIGFYVNKEYRPILGKMTIYAQKPEQKRASILLPPGIGDSFWSICKLRSFIEKENLGLPDVYIQDDGGHKRSLDCVQRFPFLNAAGYRKHSSRSPIFQEAYLKNARSLFKDVADCDYFIALNGQLRFDKGLDDILPEYKAEWHMPMFRPIEEDQIGELYTQMYGDYIVAYFVPHGMYKYWLREFPIENIYKMLKGIAKEKNCKVALIGAAWDKECIAKQLVEMDDTGKLFDLSGKTDITQMFALMRYSKGVVGFPAGNTIMATVLRVPTLLIWNSYFKESFWKYSCPPESFENWYKAIGTKNLTPEYAAESFMRICK